MMRIDKAKKALIALEGKTMRESGYWERRDIQEMICRTPDCARKQLERPREEAQPVSRCIADRMV